MENNMKRKYIHIELIDGSLYIYSDNKKRGSKLTLQDMDTECLVAEEITRDVHFCISTDEFVNK